MLSTEPLLGGVEHDVSIRQHTTSAYVEHTSSIRRAYVVEHTSAYVSTRQHTQHTSAYAAYLVSIRQHTSAYLLGRVEHAPPKTEASAYRSPRAIQHMGASMLAAMYAQRWCGAAACVAACVAASCVCCPRCASAASAPPSASVFVRVYQESKSSQALQG
jgi:hypothetical protein